MNGHPGFAHNVVLGSTKGPGLKPLFLWPLFFRGLKAIASLTLRVRALRE
jgi:hypothetical protein